MKYISKIVYIASICGLISSCSDLRFGDALLDQQPESSGATLDTLFCSKVNADKVLTKAYTNLPYGIPTNGNDRLGWNQLEALTDLSNSTRENISDGPRNLYYTGALSANLGNSSGCETYHFGGENDWSAIRYAWMYIENVNKVPDISESDKTKRVAEAKMVIAISYSEMLRNVGGVPWLDHAILVNENMKFPRLTFAQTVDHIVALLDEVIDSNLDWKQKSTEDGRMTKAAAMALKLRVLLFAASPTFNSKTLWHPNANEYTCYGNEDSQRWKRAQQAGLDLMTAIEEYKGYELVQPEEETHRARQLAYRNAYYNRGTTESLISIRRGYTNVHGDYYWEYKGALPTLNYVNMFPWADGSEFPADFNWKEVSKQPFFDGKTPTRDPRLYENVAVPGDLYRDGTLAPVYVNHPNYDKKGSGFCPMKFILHEASERNGHPDHWPYLRLAESLLGYAEAINESKGGPDPTAYACVNQVRARVGLSPLKDGMDQKVFRKAILNERALELGFEETRWYDMIRWGMEDVFRKTLYGLRTKGNQDINATEYTFEPYKLPESRHWVNNWDTKWYLAPIPQIEINKDYGMTQNPGW